MTTESDEIKIPMLPRISKKRISLRRLANTLRRDMRKASNAKILAGLDPKWINQFRKTIKVFYPANTITCKVLQGVCDVLTEVFVCHPLDIIKPMETISMSELNDVQIREHSIEEYVEKVRSFLNQDIQSLPAYKDFFEVYSLVFCDDSLYPVLRMALSLLKKTKVEKYEVLMKMTKEACDLQDALENRKKAKMLKKYMTVLDGICARAELGPQYAKPMSMFIPQEMSGPLKIAIETKHRD